MLPLTRPFEEFERIARNRPHPGLDKAYPRTTDGTTAAIIRKTPHRIVQQLPTGRVISDQNDWLTIVASFIYANRIIKNANEQYFLLQKCWSIIEKALTYGCCPTYTPFINRGDYFGPDLTIPYIGDIFLQPGKLSDLDSKYIFMRSWWQPEDIDALIDRETKLSKDKKKQEASASGWDVEALRKIKDTKSPKDQTGTTPMDKEKSMADSGVELITGFQRGVGGQFLTFHRPTKTIVRTQVNPDPKGEIPITFMYADTDGSNPLGRGMVELVGGMQNLLDAEIQMYQYNRAYNLGPAVIKKGNWNKNQAKIQPNALIDIGSDPIASLTPFTIDSTALSNFPALYGLSKSQILNLLSSPDSSISSTVGNPGFSKTDAGVKQTNANVNVDDNYIEKQFETFFERWSENAVNMYFARRSGIEELQLDQETAGKLRQLETFDQSLLSPDNKIRINYDDATEVLTFRVDPGTSRSKDDAEQSQNVLQLLDVVMKYPQLNSNFGGAIDVDTLSRRLVVTSGIENPEEVAPEATEAQKQAKEQAKNQPNPFSPMFDKPSIRMNFPDLPPVAQVALLKSAGVADITIQDVLQGPVVDPNMRGVTNPVNAPNELMPGGGPAMPAQPAQMGANPLQQDGINLTPQELQRLQQDPRFAQQGQQQPQAPQDPSQAPQPQQGNQYTPEDQQLIQELQNAGFPDDKIGQALALLHHGYNDQQILQMLGAPHA